ncbi:hypothetical protein K7432_000024 [Basidiobolus ranarum]|uniref:DED domain-containing protein n=1 Tax=Basidiobolus ranarum TaxID=34480 RepID=A0ABR2WBX8_9FUNG
MSLLNRARLFLSGLPRKSLLQNSYCIQSVSTKTTCIRHFSFYSPSYIIRISPTTKPKARSALVSTISPLHNLEQAIKSHNSEVAWASFTRLLITPNEKLLTSTHFSSLLDTLLFNKNKKSAVEKCLSLLSHMKRLQTPFQTLREHFPLVKFYILFGYKEEFKDLIHRLIEEFSFSEKEFTQLMYQISSITVKGAWSFYQQTNSALPLGEQPLLDFLSLAMQRNEVAIINEIGDHLFTLETKPTIVACQALVEAYTNCCSLDSVLKLYHRVENCVVLNARVYNMLINFFSKVTRYDLCIHMFDELARHQVTPDIITFTSMMQVYAKTLNIPSAECMFEQLLAEGFTPDVITYTTLIGMYTKATKMDKAWDMISAMEKHGVLPNLYTYTALLNGYSILNDMDGAMKVFHRMKSNGVRPDVLAYNTLLRASSNCPSDVEIQKIVGEMVESNCQPNLSTYDILMRYYLQRGDEVKIDELQNRLLGIAQSNSLAYRTLVDTYLGLSDWNRAIKVYEQMKSRHGVPIIDVFNSMLKFLSKESDGKRLLEFFRQEDLSQNVSSYNILLEHFHKNSNVNELKALYDSMLKHGIRGDFMTFNILVKAYSDAGYLSRSLNMFDIMLSKGIQPDRTLYNTLISSCFKHNESDIAFDVYQSMLDQKIAPDQHTLTILMDHYNHVGEMENVFRIWEVLVADFPKETLNSSISVLLDSLGFNGNLETLTTMWKKLKAERYILDENNYSSYIEALCRFGAHDDAMKVFMHEMASLQPSRKTCELLLKSLVSYRRKEDVEKIMDFLRLKNPDIHSTLVKI